MRGCVGISLLTNIYVPCTSTYTDIYLTLNCKTSRKVQAHFGNILGIFKLKKALPYHLSNNEKSFKPIFSKLGHILSLENVRTPQDLFVASILVNYLSEAIS